MKLEQMSAANHRLNVADLSAEGERTQFHVFSLRYIRGRSERKNPLNTPGAHRHTYFEVHMPVSGWQDYQFRDSRISLSKGKCLLIAPGAIHSLPAASADLRKFTIAFSLPSADQDTRRGWLQSALSHIAEGYVIEEPNQINRIYSLFQMIFLEAFEMRSEWIEYVKSLITCLLTEFARSVMTDKAESGIRFASEALRRVEQVERFIQDNLFLPITCPDVAHFMNFSVKQIDRNVRAVRAMSLHDLILTAKYNEAKRLMRNMDFSLQTIAARVGFSDVSSFNRFFKNKSGISPHQYRTIRAREGG